MGTYGISKKFNILANAPYVETKASAGVLHGMKGIQDLHGMAKMAGRRAKYREWNLVCVCPRRRFYSAY